FTDARGDAARRDFTINGLFEDPLTPADTPLRGANALTHGRIIDYVGGMRDLERRVVRAIGDADQRFAEDYLRMLRAVRFAARLNSRLERRTAEAIRCHAAKLTGISRERIGMEVAAMHGPGVTCTRRARAAALVQKLTLDAPTLNEPHLDVRLRTLARLP